MVDRIGEIQDRIKQFQSFSKRSTNEFKPEMVRKFEDMYRETIQQTSNNKTTEKVVHPFLKKEELKEEMITEEDIPDKSVKIDNNIALSDNKYTNKTIEQVIDDASKKYNISKDIINAVIKTESMYDQFAVSRAGAMGLMQLMPKTALELGVEKPFDVKENIMGGTAYLRKMLDRYEGNLDHALAAYNAGPHRVDAVNGIPDIEETQNYVKKIKSILLNNL